MIGLSDLGLLAGLVVGHAALSIGFLNRSHALGLSPKWMNRIALAPLLIPAVVAAWCVWILATRPILRGPHLDWASLDLQDRIFIAYAVICNLVAWTYLPAITFARRSRRQPANAVGTIEPVSLEHPSKIHSWVGDGMHAWMLRLPGNESLSLQVADWNIQLPTLPRTFGALRILHLSDLHFAHCYTLDYFKAVAEVAAAWEADLVCFTGDLLDDETTLDWTVPVLSQLQGRLGQFAILGNHDVVHRPGRVRRALRSAGYTIIDGRWVTVENEGGSIAIGGTSAPWGPKLDPNARPIADATIVMSHAPDQFPTLARWGTVDLILAGHNHGGQIRFPLIGPLVAPSRFGCRYDRGVFQRGKTIMEVTQGVGGKHPLRYGCPPEIVRLVLEPSKRTGLSVEPSAILMGGSAVS